jgi:hypothetical protein
VTLDLTSISADFLVDEAGWVPDLVLRSKGGTKSKSLPESSVTFASGNVTLSVPYFEAYGILTLVNTGAWDLYATKDETTAYIASGNVTVDMTI